MCRPGSITIPHCDSEYHIVTVLVCGVVHVHTDHPSAVESLPLHTHWLPLKQIAKTPRFEVEVDHDSWSCRQNLYALHGRSHLIYILTLLYLCIHGIALICHTKHGHCMHFFLNAGAHSSTASRLLFYSGS